MSLEPSEKKKTPSEEFNLICWQWQSKVFFFFLNIPSAKYNVEDLSNQ